VKRWFFSGKINVFVFLNITFPLGQNAFINSFPDSVVSNKSTIQRLVQRFRETGSTGEKRPSVLSNDSLEDIRARLLQSPRKSLRKLSQQTGMTYVWVLTMGYTTSQTAHGLRDFWITLYKVSKEKSCHVN
jgi:hypothetical protein